jgi:hypothetical protein
MLVIPRTTAPLDTWVASSEEEFINSLYEEPVSDGGEEQTSLNALYILYEEGIQHEETESPVEWSQNQLFDGSTNFLLANNESLQSLLTQLKLIGKNSDLYERCANGRSLVVSIINLSQGHFVTEDAVAFIQQHVLKYMIPIPYRFDLVEKFDINHNYRFIVNDNPRNYFDVINVSPPVTEDKKKRENRYGRRSPRISVNFLLPQDGSMPLSSIDLCVISVENIMSQICTSSYIDYTSGTFDYKSFAESDLFIEMAKCSGQLYQLDLESLDIDKRAFFVNVYNMMAIHVCLFS